MYRILRGHFAENENLPITAFPSNGADFGNPDWVSALHVEIMQTNARLVIIDALADVMLGRDENSVQDVQPVFLALRRVAGSTGAALVLIHHSNKNGDPYRGSSAIPAAVDLMLQVESKPESPNVDFKTKKARDIEPLHFSAVFNYNDSEQAWLVASEAREAVHYSKSQEYVIRYLGAWRGTPVRKTAFMFRTGSPPGRASRPAG